MDLEGEGALLCDTHNMHTVVLCDIVELTALLEEQKVVFV